MTKHIRYISALFIFALLLCGPVGTGTVLAQNEQFIDSPGQYERRIEGLIHERLSTLIPTGQFLLRVNVNGRMAEMPREIPAASAVDLPGFRPTDVDTPRGQEKFLVEQVLVRIVLKQPLPESDMQYLRTIVPILADIRRERGDRIDIQVIPVVEQQAPAPEEEEKPEKVIDEDRWPRPFGLSLIEWVLIIVGGLFLLIMMVVFFRLLSRLITTVMPDPKLAHAQHPPVPARPMKVEKTEEEKELEEEQKKMADERHLNQVRHSIVKRMLSRPELARTLVESWSDSPGKINMLIHGLGQRIARQALMPHMGPEAYKTLEQTVFTEKPPEASRVIGAMEEASLVLLANEVTNPELFRPNPFKFMDSLSWEQIAFLIKDEPVKVKSIVLANMKAEDTAKVIESFPKDMQLEIAVNMGNFLDLPLDMVSAVGEELAEKAKTMPDKRSLQMAGARGLVDVMGRTTSETSHHLLRGIKSKDIFLAEQVDKLFFTFEALPFVPEEILPQAVRTMPSSVVVQALQGADPDIQRRVIMAFPERARSGMVTSLRAAQEDEDTVKEARRQLVRRFQELAEKGKIDLKQISDAWQAQTKTAKAS
ncbi:MAG: hypothetical protein OEZ59_02020 [Deltaproteobacteria bacterium]|nr:hypothetical protein [Deltaproteobacteria bacterium]